MIRWRWACRPMRASVSCSGSVCVCISVCIYVCLSVCVLSIVFSSFSTHTYTNLHCWPCSLSVFLFLFLSLATQTTNTAHCSNATRNKHIYNVYISSISLYVYCMSSRAAKLSAVLSFSIFHLFVFALVAKFWAFPCHSIVYDIFVR